MYRFVGLIWDTRNPAAARAADQLQSRLTAADPTWICALDSEGAAVYHSPPPRGVLKAYVLPGERGVILGRLFSRVTTGDAEVTGVRLDERAASKFSDTAGRELTELYWGSYVAILCSPERRRVHVLRDCSGKIPCYRARLHLVDLVFSNIEDLLDIGFPMPEIQWPYIAAFIHFSHMQVRETALKGVTELLAGDRVTLGGPSLEQTALWDPVRVCTSGPIDDYATGARMLADTVRQCVVSWASVHEDVLHLLSGGFDSALVLAYLILGLDRARVTCLNRFNESPGEDERAFARVAAARAGTELVEVSLDAGMTQIDEQLLRGPFLAKPDVPITFNFLELPLKNRLARQARAEAVWTGQGGDHLFWMGSDPASAADFVFDHGPSPGLFRVMLDCARINGVCLWSVARHAIRNGLRPGRWAPSPPDNGKPYMVVPDALPADVTRYAMHPWSAVSEQLPEGQQQKIHALGALLNRHRPIGDLEAAPEHHPLLSQPLLELSLRIPTYRLVQGGRSRAMARDIFREQVPREIIEREGKGAMTLWHMSLIRRSSGFLRELLLDGELARQRLLDRRAFEAFFDLSRPLGAAQYFPLLACIAAETWARTWLQNKESQRSVAEVA